MKLNSLMHLDGGCANSTGHVAAVAGMLTRPSWPRPRRDVQPRDRDETLENSSETRRDVGYVSRPSRDQDVETETTSLLKSKWVLLQEVKNNYNEGAT